MKVVTYNMRCVYLDERYDGHNSFLFRAGMILDKIAKESPDIICFQEVETKILAFLRRTLVSYDLFGHGRNETRTGEGVFIAVKRGEFTLLSFETFWLSPTPNKPGSRYEIQSHCPRNTPVAVLMSNETGKIFRVVGIHLDYLSDEAAKPGMEQVLRYLPGAQAKLPADMTFVLGDFNMQPDSQTIGLLDTVTDFPLVDAAAESGPTFHDFGKRLQKDAKDKGIKIDYILVDADKIGLCHDLKIWDECNQGIYLSDHYPLEITVDI